MSKIIVFFISLFLTIMAYAATTYSPQFMNDVKNNFIKQNQLPMSQTTMPAPVTKTLTTPTMPATPTVQVPQAPAWPASKQPEPAKKSAPQHLNIFQ